MAHNSILYFKVMHVQNSKNRITASTEMASKIPKSILRQTLAGTVPNFPQSFISYDSRFISSE